MYFNSCLIHLKEEKKFVCLKRDHKCTRKLCSNCLFEHFTEDSKPKYMPINQFLEKSNLIITELLQKLQEKQLTERFVKIDDHSYFNLDIIKEKLKEQIIECFSVTELEILVQIASVIGHFQSACPTHLIANQNIVDLLKQFSIDIVDNFKEKNIIIKTFELYDRAQFIFQQKIQTDKIELIGEKQNDMLHGHFYYKINNNQVMYAGEYQFNEKVGQWMDIDNHVYQCGQYQDGKRIGLWKFIIDRAIVAECLYNQDGQKHGQWVDVYTNNLKQYDIIYQTGEYDNGIRIGQWTIKFKQSDELDYEMIGGGTYDKNGNKVGKWLDINQSYFSRNSQIIWEGHYQAGIRVGDWKIKYRQYSSDLLLYIGGGKFDENGQKVGYWLDINESDFNIKFQVIWIGWYKQGVRVGQWKLNYLQYIKKKKIIEIYHYSNEFSYGGKFDQKGEKVGFWKDMDEYNFNSALVWEGFYQNGLRIGEWKIKCLIDFNNKQFKQIGGGIFDQYGKKVGFWNEVKDFNNYQQIIWVGQYQNGVQVGEWKINYCYGQQNQKSLLIGGGMFDQNGKKVGLWNDISEFYFESQIVWEGCYQDGQRVGEWKIKYFKNLEKLQLSQIGGGMYDLEGKKVGFWNDINECYFRNNSQVIWVGWYQKSIRGGEWQIKYRENSQNKPFTKIGGGLFDYFGNKVGMWKEIIEQFFDCWSPVIFNGLYQEGLRVGDWYIDWCQKFHDNKLIQIGGGKYDDSGNKVGKWFDIIESDSNYSKIILECNYSEQGLRVGYQNIFRCQFSSTQPYIHIGGGEYDLKGKQVGIWKEIVKSKNFLEQLYCEGSYQEGLKTGEWKIKYMNTQQNSAQIQIGVGEYDEKGNKVGIWEEIKGFYGYSGRRIVWEGRYQAGFRYGEWKIKYCDNHSGKFIQIGSGQFDQGGNKIGYWEENDEIFSPISFHHNKFLINWEGNYHEGLRVGEWKMKYRKNSFDTPFKFIGGGQFDEVERKTGKWVEIDECYVYLNQEIFWEGNYNKGIRVGEWKLKLIDPDPSQPIIFIGGGEYDLKGKRIGYWKEMDFLFQIDSKIIWEGNYKEDVRVGQWKIKYRFDSSKPLIQIGGGMFDQNGSKVGYWMDYTEIHSLSHLLIIWEGQYQQGVKVGEWKMKYREKSSEKPFTYIGGGSYDQDSVKVGKWEEIFEEYFHLDQQIFWEGNYHQGIRVGKWNIKQIVQNSSISIISIGGGEYDLKGEKIGVWEEICDECCQKNPYITWEGQYKENIRVGEWQIKQKDPNQSQSVIIGGGKFNENGEKIGKWLELNFSYIIEKNYKDS